MFRERIMCELPSPYRSKNLKVVFVRWKVLVNLIIKFVDEIVTVVYSSIIKRPLDFLHRRRDLSC